MTKRVTVIMKVCHKHRDASCIYVIVIYSVVNSEHIHTEARLQLNRV